MMLVELFAPDGALHDRRRHDLAERLLHTLTTHDGVPPEVVEAGRRLWHVVVHEPKVWVTGGGVVEPENPRYFVRVSLPSDASMMTDEARNYLVSTITRVLADAHDATDRFAREPLVAVHLVDVPELGYGTMGRAMRNVDIVRLVMGDIDATPVASPVVQGADTAVDPICGMTVALTGTAITLEHDAATYAFCTGACRELFAERLATTAR
jgi:YHS domain-containing protein